MLKRLYIEYKLAYFCNKYNLLFFTLPEPFISFKWNNDHDSLKIGANHLYLRSNKKFYQFDFSEIISAELLTKKKLAPLVTGAIISSLAMVNILLEGASLYMVGFFSIGLLILYFGLTDYWVIKIVHPQDTTQLWINKNKTPNFPEVILSVVHYRIAQGYFPFLYCEIPKDELSSYIEEINENDPESASINYFLLPPKHKERHVTLKVDATRLTKQIKFHQQPGFLAYGNYKINKAALVGKEV